MKPRSVRLFDRIARMVAGRWSAQSTALRRRRVGAFLIPSPYWQYDRRFRFDDRVINSMKETMLTILRRAIRGYGRSRQLSNMAQIQTRMSAMREEIHIETRLMHVTVRLPANRLSIA